MAEKRKSPGDDPPERSPETYRTTDWDDYFMSIAYVASKRSGDPKTKVGACIVNQENHVVALGYNRMPDRCDFLSWDKKTKKSRVCHAEMNAILERNGADCKECTIYTTLFPCCECAKIIIQAGIKRVVFLGKREKPEYKDSQTLLEHAKVELIDHEPKTEPIQIDLEKAKKDLSQ